MEQVTQEKWIELFKMFMRKKGLWEKYFMSCVEHGTYIHRDGFLNHIDPERFITQAFHWSDDNLIDWGKIDNEWQNYRRQILTDTETDTEYEIDDIEAKGKIVKLGEEIVSLLRKHFHKNTAIYIDTEGVGFQDNYDVYHVDEED